MSISALNHFGCSGGDKIFPKENERKMQDLVRTVFSAKREKTNAINDRFRGVRQLVNQTRKRVLENHRDFVEDRNFTLRYKNFPGVNTANFFKRDLLRLYVRGENLLAQLKRLKTLEEEEGQSFLELKQNRKEELRSFIKGARVLKEWCPTDPSIDRIIRTQGQITLKRRKSSPKLPAGRAEKTAGLISKMQKNLEGLGRLYYPPHRERIYINLQNNTIYK